MGADYTNITDRSEGLRVSILGGGSAYTPGLIEGFIRQKHKVPLKELVLMDIDGEKLETVGSLVSRMVEKELPGVRVTLTGDRARAIRGMDFILCQIRVGGLAARHVDESVPLRFGVIGQETTGPGGFSMALRTIPVMVEIAREIEALNPSAWLINYTNPTGLVAEAIKRTSNIKHISICDEPMVLQESLASFLKVPPEKLFFDYFGLNHLAWARRVFLQGKDILPELRRAVREVPFEKIEPLFGEEVLKDPKVRMELENTLRIFVETGMLPSPYLQYYFFTDEILSYQRKTGKTRAQEVMELEKDLLSEYRLVTQGVRALEIRRGGKWHADMMVGMLGAIASDTREVYIVNVPNRGSIPDLPYEKIVEVPALVDAGGAHPLAAGRMPKEVRGLIQAVAAYEELTVEAALEGSYEKALQALGCHPLVPSRTVARKILDAYLDEHREYLPQFRSKTS
ncbi:MAG: 6-phospho-beta-glucosidase [Candidatus Fermentithermobacillus carboniphilus]|uniref:6-phospho-beta-glucosidase n=1 Tax=Candidatus Fermentithermobacillus carboniphilus TaxID=3085328 RepID=A0AAT9LBH5_9FIRM|nr:MAG: 6-phospho-beta-glucosidase [Candidatus Fermentithermobacillus carboniphilus]